MKISREWLQTYFDKNLPESEDLANMLTFHAFEIDGVENDVLDVKVTPNRGHDCLSYEGIAREVSAISGITLKEGMEDNVAPRPQAAAPNDHVDVNIQDEHLCLRYAVAHIRGIKVGPSPDWMIARLESMGQHSINNIVDATNYAMFATGQPLHAFDTSKLTQRDKKYSMSVRVAREGEQIMALDGKQYELKNDMLIIADGNTDTPIGIAGIKGGMACAIDDNTQDIILESANFDGVSVRRSAQSLKIRTDSSARFEQQISPILTERGMNMAIRLILKIAGGELVYINDTHGDSATNVSQIKVSLKKINSVLGTNLSIERVTDVFSGLNFQCSRKDEVFSVTPSPERLDIFIAEDLIEEVGRIVGFDCIPAIQLPTKIARDVNDQEWVRLQKIRLYLVAQGFSEVFTSVFAEHGERVTTNKVDGKRPFLRDNLATGLVDALERNIRIKEILGLQQIKIFEIGTVWRDGEETTIVELAVENIKKMKTTDDYVVALNMFMHGDMSLQNISVVGAPLERYRHFSRYPYIVRDIALWVPEGTTTEEVRLVIAQNSGELAVRIDLFDTFTKGDRTSYAFRIVFQSMDRTLFENDANERMESIYVAVQKLGWVVR